LSDLLGWWFAAEFTGFFPQATVCNVSVAASLNAATKLAQLLTKNFRAGQKQAFRRCVLQTTF
jgi:hypothetical protein